MVAAPQVATRGAAMLATLMSAAGSVLVGRAWLDTVRYARFVAEVRAWLLPVPSMTSVPHDETILAVVASTVALASITVAVLARAQRARGVALAGMLSVVALAFVVAQGGVLAVAREAMGPQSHDPELAGPWLALAGTGAVIPLAAAWATARIVSSVEAGIATLAAALPLVTASGIVALCASELGPSSASDALTAPLRDALDGQTWVAIAAIPAALVAFRVRAPRAALGLGGTWLVIAACVAFATRPFALDAAASHPDEHWPMGCWFDSYNVLTLSFPGPTSDGDTLTAPAELGERLIARHRAWAILHPQTPYYVGLAVRVERGAPPDAATLRPWLAAALASEIDSVAFVYDARQTWSTRSAGILTRTSVCAHFAQLDDAPMPSDFDPGSLFVPGTQPDISLGVGERR
jgi:hypothetical protein